VIEPKTLNLTWYANTVDLSIQPQAGLQEFTPISTVFSGSPVSLSA